MPKTPIPLLASIVNYFELEAVSKSQMKHLCNMSEQGGKRNYHACIICTSRVVYYALCVKADV